MARQVQARIKKPPRKTPQPEPEAIEVEESPPCYDRYHVEVLSDVGRAILHGLVNAGSIRITHVEALEGDEPEEELELCTVCDTRTSELGGSVGGEPVCLLCARAAGQLKEKFEEAVRREREGFDSQLQQMVKDVRSGAGYEVTFYRGFE